MRRMNCISLILCVVMILALCGCGNKIQSVNSNNVETSENKSTDDDVLDLTKFNNTMLYSEVYNMGLEPDRYMGKTIKIAGTTAIYEGETTGGNYYYCMVSDATACCTQGIEFDLNDSYSYPDDYPETGSNVVVSGVFGKYEENGYTYYALKDAVLL